MPWIGPASKSCRGARLAAPLPRFAAAVVFLAGRDAAAVGFFLLAVLFADLPPDLLADFVGGLAAVFLRAAVFPAPFAAFLLAFFVAFFLAGFFDADFFGAFLAAFFADFPGVARFFRAAGFFFDDFFAVAFFAVAFFALTLRFLPAVFLPAADFRDAVAFLPVPARFRFLLAAFFAGMFHSCRSEKNAELYIGCPNMEAYLNGISLAPGTLFSPAIAAFMKWRSRFRHPCLVHCGGERDACELPFSPDVFLARTDSEIPRLCIARSPMSDCRDNRFMRRITLH